MFLFPRFLTRRGSISCLSIIIRNSQKPVSENVSLGEAKRAAYVVKGKLYTEMFIALASCSINSIIPCIHSVQFILFENWSVIECSGNKITPGISLFVSDTFDVVLFTTRLISFPFSLLDQFFGFWHIYRRLISSDEPKGQWIHDICLEGKQDSESRNNLDC